MSFIINQNFDLKSPQFNFARDYFDNVASLKAASENDFPDHFITNVAGTLYQLTKSNSVDSTTGKWRKVKLGSDVDLSKCLVYKGTVDAKYSLPTKNVKIGDVYIVNTNGIFAGQTCESGDMIIAQTASNNEGTPTPTWTVVQTNINGAVTSTENLTASKLVVGNNNKSIKVATGSGLVKLTEGVVSYDNNTYLTTASASNIYAKKTDLSSYLTSVPKATTSVVGGGKVVNVHNATAELTNTDPTASNVTLYGLQIDKDGNFFTPVKNAATYSLPVATKDILGGIKIGFEQDDDNHNYPIALNTSSQAYVNLPLATYDMFTDIGQKDGLITGAERRAINSLSLNSVSVENSGLRLILNGVIGKNNSTVNIPFVTPIMNDKSYGLMRGSDKNKLDSIERGANKTTITDKVAQDDINAVSSGGVFAALSNKVDKATGKGLSTNDFTTEYKTKLDNITNITKSEIDNLFN